MSTCNGAILPQTCLRRARTAEVAAMQQLINGYADAGLMLHRSLSQLYENIRDFYVVEQGDRVVGCAALHVSWKDLAEIKSLAVAEDSQGRGCARRLVEACIADARELGIERVFALTYVPVLFERMGFRIVDKAELPRKVWTECVYCPKFPDCGEIAVVIDLVEPSRDARRSTLIPLASVRA